MRFQEKRRKGILKMPALAEDVRPKTLRSGITLQPKYSVQHRSDMLIAEQIESVTDKQTTLMEVLDRLDNAKTDEEVDILRSEAQALKEKADAGLVILNILYKINHELKYAREDLEEALDHQHGDILAARKRVMWLEDRMGALCGKVRLRGQASNRPSQRTRGSTERGGMTITFRSNVSDSELSEDDDRDFGRGKALPPIRQINSDSEDQDRGGRGGMGRMVETPSMSGSEEYRDVQMKRPGMMDTPSSSTSSPVSPVKMVMLHQKGPHQYSDSEESDEDNTSPVPPPALPLTQGQRSPSSSEGDSKEESEGNDQVGDLPSMFQRERREYSGLNSRSPDTAVHDSVIIAPTEASAPQVTSPKSESPDSERAGPTSVEQEEEKLESQEADKDGEEESGKDKTDKQTDETVEKVEGTEEQTEEGEGKPEEAKVVQEEEKRQEEKTFITEVSAQTNKSRVTIVTPKREDTRQEKVYKQKKFKPAFLREISEEERDVVMEYWQSEHHRFEYGDYADVLTQLDPLSYHQMGLAVPGSFLRRVDKEFEELPWNIKPNEKKSSDITDIHKRALDKLALKVHNMYDKVFRATMMSVRPTRKSNEAQREISFFKSIDSKEGTMTSSLLGSKALVSTAQSEGKRPETIQSLASMELSKAEKRKLVVSTGRLIYYPKPIPPPEVLPLTRTTEGKEYPKLADSYEENGSKRRRPAIRIADQRNLAQETKLTLYKERSRGRAKGPSTTEQKFRMMLQEQKSAGSSRKADSASKPGLLKAMTNASLDLMDDEPFDINTVLEETIDSEGSVWSRMKPKSRNREYSGLKWERVKSIVHNNLVSKRVEERIDAAKHLGLLRVGDAMVFYALKERMRNDEDQRVRYEAAKSLILVGCWEEDVQQVVLKYLVIGNTEIRLDLIKTMQEGKNVQYVDKTLSTFPELVKVLSHFSKNPDPEDTTSLEAAVLLGKLCVNDQNAETRLKQSLRSHTDTHQKAKSLEILVKQLNCKDKDIVRSTLDMIANSFVWKYRVMASELLITLGTKYVCRDPELTEKVYETLEKRLWDEPTKEVRLASAKALTALGMFGKACDKVEKRLEDSDEDARAEAVISVGTLGMKNEKITRLLLEMLELDASDYVRLMVVRTFVTLNSTDKRIIRALRERERAEGALGREAKKAVQTLEALTQLPPPSSPRRSVTPSKKVANSALSFVRPLTQSV